MHYHREVHCLQSKVALKSQEATQGQAELENGTKLGDTNKQDSRGPIRMKD